MIYFLECNIVNLFQVTSMDISHKGGISPCIIIFRDGISDGRISADIIGRYIGSDEPISVIGISVKSHRYANPDPKQHLASLGLLKTTQKLLKDT